MLFFRLFRKVDPSCAYCRYGTRIGERDVACLKRGVVPVEHHCRAFRYDPLKRTPPRPALLRLGGLGEEDFLLDAVPGQETLFAGMDAAAGRGPDAESSGKGGELSRKDGETAGALESADTLNMAGALESANGLNMTDTLNMAEDLKAVKGTAERETAEEVETPETPEAAEPIEEPEDTEEPETAEDTPKETPEAAKEAEASEETAETEETEKRPMKVKVRAVKIRR